MTDPVVSSYPGVRRVICRIRGHKTVRRFDRINIDSATVLGDVRFRVLDESKYCARCGKDPL